MTVHKKPGNQCMTSCEVDVFTSNQEMTVYQVWESISDSIPSQDIDVQQHCQRYSTNLRKLMCCSTPSLENDVITAYQLPEPG